MAGTSIVVTTTQTFTGIVTYCGGKEVYLQNESQAMVALLDKKPANGQDLVGKLVTVTGEAMTGSHNRRSLTDAEIQAVDDTEDVVSPAPATIEQLRDWGMFARLVELRITKQEMADARLEPYSEDYPDGHILTITGVCSYSSWRVLLGATVEAEPHTPGEPEQENEVEAACTEPGSYDEVVYCSVCHEELSREQKQTEALGHLPGEPVRENVDEAAWTYDVVVYCERCQAELSREQKPLQKTLGTMTITGEPQDQKVAVKAKAVFSVAAKNAKSYQWYCRTSPEKPWAKASGGTKAILTVTAKAEYNGYQYYCEVRNADGNLSSHVVTLTVIVPPPVIKTQPKSVKVKSGTAAKFSVKASGTKLTYQWYSRGPEDEDWTAIDGATKADYSFTTTKDDSGLQFRCRVKSSDGEAYSNPAPLTVIPQAPVIKTQPKAVKVKSGAKAKFNVKASGSNLSYQWYSWDALISDWAAIEGATKAEYAFTAVKADDGRQFRCRVKNGDGEAYSNPAALTVTAQPPKVKTQPKDAKVKVGAKAKFTVKASGPNLSYQWYTRAADADEWTPIPGATAATLTVIASIDNAGHQFCCRVENADGRDESRAATLILK